MTSTIQLPLDLPCDRPDLAEAEFLSFRREAVATVLREAGLHRDAVEIVSPGTAAVQRVAANHGRPNWARFVQEWRRAIVFSGPVAVLAWMVSTGSSGPLPEQVQLQHTALGLICFVAWLLLVMVGIGDMGSRRPSLRECLGTLSVGVWGVGSKAVYVRTSHAGVMAVGYGEIRAIEKARWCGLDTAILRGHSGCEEAWIALDGLFESDPGVARIRQRLEEFHAAGGAMARSR